MSKKFKSMDGNNAAAYVSYAFTEVAGIYPITPSSPMADYVDQWAAQGKKNIFGTTVKVCEMESEGGAAGTVHGSLTTGALTTTYTASQGLLLMIPNMYKIAAEQLPAVFHVSARTVATQSLNIFGDHSDVMACRQTGFAMLAEGNVQEVMDLSAVAHLAAIKGRMPFINFFDGFRTSHEIQKVSVWDYDDLAELCDMDAVRAFRAHAINPETPAMRGSHENGDIFFQNREACNSHYDALPAVVEECMDKVNAKLGTDYKLFNYYGAPDADRVIVCMGSLADVAEEVIDYLNAHGEKVGLVKVRLYRPFVKERFAEALPATVKKIAVMDRTKEPGSLGEPLYLDVVTALAELGMLSDLKVVGGRYGLGSKEFNPTMVKAVYDNLAGAMKNHFTVGIEDDVTGTSLPLGEQLITAPEGTVCCMFYGLGSDGTVGANKNSIKIIGDHTDMYAQGYFSYDSKKSGGLTVSHLRFGKTPIQSTYLIDAADFVACHNPSYVTKYDMVSKVKDGGVFLLNCQWKADELEQHLPASMKQMLAKKHARLYIIDAIDLAAKVGMGNRINTIMQAAFFKLANVIPYEQADEYMKAYAKKAYGKKGDEVVKKNWDAIDIAISGLVEIPVPAEWANATTGAVPVKVEATEYFDEVIQPILAQEGDKLPVSKLDPAGVVPTGTTKYEKRGIAVMVPEWQIDNCIQCCQCAMVCPHACIRPYMVDDEGKANAPETFATKPALGPKFKGLTFRMQVSPLDCTGCENCAQVCPAKNKALVMKPLATQTAEEKNWEYAQTLPEFKGEAHPKTIKDAQLKKPLFEFSGACAGCGETPYIKLLTQMFGDKMYLANATGCTQAWGAAMPCVPYCKNAEGKGVAWSNSLFENNAEFSYGMCLAVKQLRDCVTGYVKELDALTKDEAVKAAIAKYMETYDDLDASTPATAELVALLEKGKFSADEQKLVDEILKRKKDLSKKTMWMYGGDGWAYDIGYGGLDHVLASGKDVNVFVFDTEVYSNTGGQASKASNLGQVAQFAAAGKDVKKKSLAEIAMTYGYVYVAQVAMGANLNQTIKAITEAEAYPGPSLIIGYSPCEMHSIKGGMTNCQTEMKKAVDCGYWNLLRFNPEGAPGKKLVIDSKDPAEGEYQNFLMNEARYSRLTREFPERAEELFAENEQAAMARWSHLQKLKDLYAAE